jgi:acyl carrier protein
MVHGRPLTVAASRDELVNGDIERRVRQILAEILRLEPSEVGNDASLGTTPGWDSANHINLVLSLEEEFSVTLDVAEIETMTSFLDVTRIVEGKL